MRFEPLEAQSKSSIAEIDLQKVESNSSIRYLRLKRRGRIREIFETKVSKFPLACASTKIAIILSNFHKFRTSCALNRCFLFWQLIKRGFKWFQVILKHVLSI